MTSFEGNIEIGHCLLGTKNLGDPYELARDLLRMYSTLSNLEDGAIFEDDVRWRKPRSLNVR
jgi:hypothetical protein